MSKRRLLALAFLGAAACSDDLPDAPTDLTITPDNGAIGTPTRVTIRGKNLTQFAKTNFSDPKASLLAPMKVTVGGQDLIDVSVTDRDKIEGTVPARSDLGVYDLIVTDQYGREARSAQAFRI